MILLTCDCCLINSSDNICDYHGHDDGRFPARNTDASCCVRQVLGVWGGCAEVILLLHSSSGELLHGG